MTSFTIMSSLVRLRPSWALLVPARLALSSMSSPGGSISAPLLATSLSTEGHSAVDSLVELLTYAERADAHEGTAIVREGTKFSACLRQLCYVPRERVTLFAELIGAVSPSIQIAILFSPLLTTILTTSRGVTIAYPDSSSRLISVCRPAHCYWKGLLHPVEYQVRLRIGGEMVSSCSLSSSSPSF